MKLTGGKVVVAALIVLSGVALAQSKPTGFSFGRGRDMPCFADVYTQAAPRRGRCAGERPRPCSAWKAATGAGLSGGP
jgi:hypothetical protein